MPSTLPGGDATDVGFRIACPSRKLRRPAPPLQKSGLNPRWTDRHGAWRRHSLRRLVRHKRKTVSPPLQASIQYSVLLAWMALATRRSHHLAAFAAGCFMDAIFGRDRRTIWWATTDAVFGRDRESGLVLFVRNGHSFNLHQQFGPADIGDGVDRRQLAQPLFTDLADAGVVLLALDVDPHIAQAIQ